MKLRNRLWFILTGLFATACFLFANIQFASSANPGGALADEGRRYNVKSFGATGDGKTLDTAAINKSNRYRRGRGGGTVRFPAGNYLSVSIHLKSNIFALHRSGGYDCRRRHHQRRPSTIRPSQTNGTNSRTSATVTFTTASSGAKNLENISILGQERSGARALCARASSPGPRSRTTSSALHRRIRAALCYPNPRDAVEPGWGNKAISLKLCRNVTLRDVSILHGGHFAILATGVGQSDH